MLPATIMSINQAFPEIKRFGGKDWEGDYRCWMSDYFDLNFLINLNP